MCGVCSVFWVLGSVFCVLCSVECVVVVEWFYYSETIIIVRWADLSDFFVHFRR